MNIASVALTHRLRTAALLAIVREGATSVNQMRITGELSAKLPELLDRFQINTPLRISHFLAQIAHESDSFRTLEEYASGSAYELREDLGNIKPGDGRRYKGRSPMQVTGRSNYRNLTAWLKSAGIQCPDFEADPVKLGEAEWAAWACVWYWETRSINKLADRDDLVLVTKVINGGRKGLASRAKLLSRAKEVIAGLQAAKFGAEGFSVLRRGSNGKDVEDLQRLLQEAGVYLATVDGSFGVATELAVKQFQLNNRLTPDGIVGPATFSAISKFADRQGSAA